MKKVSIDVPKFSFHSFIVYHKAQYDDEKILETELWKPGAIIWRGFYIGISDGVTFLYNCLLSFYTIQIIVFLNTAMCSLINAYTAKSLI